MPIPVKEAHEIYWKEETKSLLDDGVEGYNQAIYDRKLEDEDWMIEIITASIDNSICLKIEEIKKGPTEIPRPPLFNTYDLHSFYVDKIVPLYKGTGFTLYVTLVNGLRLYVKLDEHKFSWEEKLK